MKRDAPAAACLHRRVVRRRLHCGKSTRGGASRGEDNHDRHHLKAGWSHAMLHCSDGRCSHARRRPHCNLRRAPRDDGVSPHENHQSRHYGKETMEEFKKALSLLRQAHIYVQRIDWLVSGDDGEDSFHSRLKHDMETI
jgi:hypothetical protein